MAMVSLPKMERGRGKGFFLLAGLFVGLAIFGSPDGARATGSQPFIGEISCGGWNFCPQGWAECNGQLMAISEDEVLFQLIGTTYGGDGQVTFAMPNLNSRTMLGTGSGAGGSYMLGQMAGTESVTLTTNQIPSHTHALVVQDTTGDSASPTNKVVAGVGAGDARYVDPNTSPPAGFLSNGAISSVGGSQPHNNLQPYLAVKCCISLFGIFPSQN